jgi:hypothetical protein
MATRSKARRTTSRRGTPAVAVGRPVKKSGPARRAGEAKRRPEAGKAAPKRATRATVVERRVIPAPLSPFQRALRYLATLADYERLRIVRYNPVNFNLDRMRALL